MLLGDTHYDLPEHHDMDWVRQNKPNDVSQIRGYIDVSQKHTPALLQRVKAAIAGSTVPVPFVAHVGDLVEGLCGSYDLAARQFSDALALIDKTQLGAPFLMSKGNHDITGPGATDAYEKVFLPWLSNQRKQPITQAAFSHRHQDDLFVFFDAYKPDNEWLEAQFKQNADARHTFVIIHEPVVPYNARVDWIVYSKDKDQPQRERLLELLGQRHAVVLSGHLHKYSYLERTTSTGTFSQLAVCSVVRSDHAQPREERKGLDAYSPDLLELEPKFEPTSRTQRQNFLKNEKPSITTFDYADLPGFAVIDVFPTIVKCKIFPGTDTTPYRNLPIEVATSA